MTVFRKVKQTALKAIEDKRTWLEKNGGESHVIEHYLEIWRDFNEAISSQEALEKCFLLTMFRSHVLDIEDDLEGKSCTPLTLKRLTMVKENLKYHFELLERHGALFYQNKGASLEELRLRYEQKFELAEGCQL